MKHDLASFRNIDISAKVRNVKIDIAGDNTYGYEITNRPYSKIYHEMKGATLCITEKLNRLFLFIYIFDVLRGLKKLDIIIHIPGNAELGSVTLKNTSGNTVVKEIKCVTLDTNATSGNIAFNAGSAEHARVRQTSGRLRIDGCLIVNGDIQNTSGKVEIRHTRMCGLTVSTTSGRTVFTGDVTGITDIKSTSGDISLDLASKKRDYDMNIDVLSGNIYTDGQKQRRQKELRDRKGDASRNELRLKTISGNVRMNFGGEK